MRKFLMILATVGAVSATAVSNTSAAPVPGFEDLYTSLIAACSLPNGTVADCEAAITAYAGALVNSVDITVANASFAEARAEVFALNAADGAFQADVEALFELLLPESGAVAPAASPTVPG